MKRWAELASAAILPRMCGVENGTGRDTENWLRRCLGQPLKVDDLEPDTEYRWFMLHRRPFPRVMGKFLL